jgi:hypothetical protein
MFKKILPLLIITFIGCSKADKEFLSSDKTISSVVLKKSDNPGLSTDITASSSSNNITFEIPDNVAINNLVPTIDFSGKTIEPANRTAQDFTNGVNYKITAKDGSTTSYSFRVSSVSSDTATLILGVWKVIKDSVVNNSWINPTNYMSYLIPGVYIGNANDFWKFDADGVFSMQENGISGTDTYSIQPDNKLEIPVWSRQYGAATIEKINSTVLTVYFHATSSNGGHYHRKVYLKR